jgi:hypothetical protein
MSASDVGRPGYCKHGNDIHGRHCGACDDAEIAALSAEVERLTREVGEQAVELIAETTRAGAAEARAKKAEAEVADRVLKALALISDAEKTKKACGACDTDHGVHQVRGWKEHSETCREYHYGAGYSDGFDTRNKEVDDLLDLAKRALTVIGGCLTTPPCGNCVACNLFNATKD